MHLKRASLRLLTGTLFLASTFLRAQPALTLEKLTDELILPVEITHAGDGSGRLFVLELDGRVRIVRNDTLEPASFLDLTDRVAQVDNGGLLGLAFHPDYAENRRFFVHYTRADGGQIINVISEFKVSAVDPDKALTQERVILEIERPNGMHPSGDLAFGPDGFLYINSGDPGVPGEPAALAQDTGSLLGKILRIDIDGEQPYAIPPDNPFVDQEGARPEIWALGFRNPFRITFDRLTGRLFAADVGQARIEEVNVIQRGGNYGWNQLEGSLCFPEEVQQCPSEGLIPPVHEYGRQDGASVIGGVVYRGPDQSGPWGDYIFGDFVSRRIWALRQVAADRWVRRQLLLADFMPTTFGEDEQGTVYVAALLEGAIYRMRFGWQQLLPVFFDGQIGEWRFLSTLHFSNASDQPVAGRIDSFDPQGQPVDAELTGLGEDSSFVVPAGQALQLSTPGDGDLVTGWLRVLTDRPMTASLSLISRTDAAVGGLSGMLAAPTSTGYVGAVTRSVFFSLDTGLVVVNPFEAETCEVQIRLADADGNEIGAAQITLEPLESRTTFIWEVVALPDEFSGTVTLTSDRDFAATILTTRAGLADGNRTLANQ